MIYTLRNDNKVKATLIEIEGVVDNLYVVKSGLKLGDKIVTTGVSKLKNGMTISPQDISFDEAIKPIKTLFKN